MSDRRPLVQPPPEELARIRGELGVDENNLPLNLTPAEQVAAANPGLPAPPEQPPMENTTQKDGWKTSEFWLTVLGFLLGAFLIVYGVLKGQPELVEKGMIIVTGGSAAYTAGRALTKTGGLAGLLFGHRPQLPPSAPPNP